MPSVVKRKKALIGNRKAFLIFNATIRLSKSSDLVSSSGFRQKSAQNTYRGSIAMRYETFLLFNLQIYITLVQREIILGRRYGKV